MNTDAGMNKTLMKLVEEYANCDHKSAELNEQRANIRENIEKLGVPPKAFMRFVADQKQMSPGEFRDMQAGYERMQEAAEAEGIDVQGQFWPGLKKAADKRAERRAEKEKGRAGAPNPDDNPRSDPNRGGAKPNTKGKKGETGNVVQLQPPSGEQQQTEGQEGDAVLNGLTPETQAAQNAALNPDGKPKSQSQIAAEKMEAAKLSGAKLN